MMERVGKSLRGEKHSRAPLVDPALRRILARNDDFVRRTVPTMNDETRLFLVELRSFPPILCFEPAFGTVDRGGPTLEGGVRDQRVGKLRTARVADHHAHRVFDVDVFPKDAPIADVTVVLLDVVVEPGIVVRADVEIKLAAIFVVAGGTTFPAFLPRRAVKLECSDGEHLRG